MQRSLVLIFDNFGPYHWARITAAAKATPVLPIQVFGESHEYEWKDSSGSDRQRLRTLLSVGGRTDGVQSAAIRRHMLIALDEEQPAAVAIPGWSSVAALCALKWCVQKRRMAIVMSESTEHDAGRKVATEGIKRQIISLFSAALVGGRPQASYLEALGMDSRLIFTGYDAVDNCYFTNGATPALRSSLLGFAPDLVHTHGLWTYPSALASRWHSQFRKPTIVSPQGMLDPWALQNSRWKKRIAWNLWEQTHLREAACLHAVCPAEADAMKDYGLRNPICIIPNGVDLPLGAPSLEKPRWDKLAAGRKVILFISRLHPKKGLPNLLRAWRQALSSLPEANKSWCLIIAGWDQGGHQAELERLVHDLELSASVNLVGAIFGDEKDAALRRADAFVLPSFSEGLPLAILEAWSYRLPVLMTPQCNIPEGFSADAAISAEPNVQSLAEGLRALFSLDDSERAAMGERGRGLVEQKFLWSQVAARMKKVYDWVLGQGEMPDSVTR